MFLINSPLGLQGPRSVMSVITFLCPTPSLSLQLERDMTSCIQNRFNFSGQTVGITGPCGCSINVFLVYIASTSRTSLHVAVIDVFRMTSYNNLGGIFTQPFNKLCEF